MLLSLPPPNRRDHLAVERSAIAAPGGRLIVSGAVEVFTALSHREMQHRGRNAVMGIVSVLAGIVILVYPGISLLVLAVLLGIWLIIFGAMQIMVAFRIRSLAHA